MRRLHLVAQMSSSITVNTVSPGQGTQGPVGVRVAIRGLPVGVGSVPVGDLFCCEWVCLGLGCWWVVPLVAGTWLSDVVARPTGLLFPGVLGSRGLTAEAGGKAGEDNGEGEAAAPTRPCSRFSAFC